MLHMKHASPTRKLADALFRGRGNQHTFKVYPLLANITDQPAVFIISRRIVDRNGRGHHAVVCIGETASTAKEFRKHKRAKCVKDHGANAVCVLKEKDEEGRVGIIDDLVSNRSFSCVNNVYKHKIDSGQKQRQRKVKESVARTKSDEKIRSAKSTARPARPAAQRAESSKTGTRVQSSVDRNRRQHRLSDAKRAVGTKAKGRAARKSGTGKKAAA